MEFYLLYNMLVYSSTSAEINGGNIEKQYKKIEGNFLEQAIRVNHAGEYGAICIYSGQKFILKNLP